MDAEGRVIPVVEDDQGEGMKNELAPEVAEEVGRFIPAANKNVSHLLKKKEKNRKRNKMAAKSRKRNRG